jgi:hypothetical protein
MLRTEDTDEDVDLRPRRPVLDLLNVPRGVKGEGERECRLLLGVVYIREIGGWLVGPGTRRGLNGGVFDVAGRGLGSLLPLELFGDFFARSGVDLLNLLPPGDFVRLAESSSQCFQ